MTTLTCRAVLADMDGTLVDSTALVDRIWTTFSAEHGLDARAVLAFAHGRPSVATLREFLPDHPDLGESPPQRGRSQNVGGERLAAGRERRIAG